MSENEQTGENIPQIRMIAIDRISPDSEINSRRSGIEDNAKKLQASIETHGFRPEHPVLVRPFPGESSQYDWEPVSGRSRLKGAQLAGRTMVPAIVEEMDDEKAHLLSFQENEARANLTVGDKTYWFEKKFKSLRDEGHSIRHSQEMTAEFYGLTRQTIQSYLLLATLPDEIIDDIERKILPQSTGKAIAQRYAGIAEENQRSSMLEAAGWCKQVPNQYRNLRDDAIEAAKNEGVFQDLEEALQAITSQGPTSLNIQIAPSMGARLERFAEMKGYPSIEAALPMLLAQMVEDASIE